MKPRFCPFCGSSVSLVDSIKVYGRSYGLLYLCDSYPKCDARVGCHPGTVTPLGTLANKELRYWRNKAHSALDLLWKSGKMSRNAAYKWLAQQMRLPKSQTHIGIFDKQQCQAAITSVKELALCRGCNTTKPMIKPLGYYASAPSSTTDAAILTEIEDRYGSQLENLTPSQKSAWLIALMSEAIEPEGVEVNYSIDNISDAKQLCNLSYGAKLCLCNALINQLLLCGSH